MLPEKLSWITEGFEPEGDPWLLLQIARDLEAEGNLEGSAVAFDRAFGIAPEIDRIRLGREAVLNRLEVREHGLVFRYVPGGPFLMGNRDGEPDEAFMHPVWLSPFWISATPISWHDYCRLLDWEPAPVSRPREADDIFLLHQNNKIRRYYCGSRALGDDANHPNAVPRFPNSTEHYRYDLKPMVAVGWQEAEDLASRLSTFTVRYHLPSEAQWEKAARGGLIGARYPWGDDPPTDDNCDFDNFRSYSIRPVTSLPPNGYGLYAMCGGVWEWCSDWYDAEYYFESPTDDPAGPPTGQEKVLRGGCWADCADVVTTTYRMSRESKHWRNWRSEGHGFGGQLTPNLGFRLCRSVNPSPEA